MIINVNIYNISRDFILLFFIFLQKKTSKRECNARMKKAGDGGWWLHTYITQNERINKIQQASVSILKNITKSYIYSLSRMERERKKKEKKSKKNQLKIVIA